MDLIKTEAIKAWKSIRKYRPDAVPDAKIKAVLQAACRAPSWSNTQPWHFIVVKDFETRKKLRKLSMGQNHLLEAPVCIVCCGDMESLSLTRHRSSIIELSEVGTQNRTTSFIDEKLMKNTTLIPALGGNHEIEHKVREQQGFTISFLILEAVNQSLGACILGGIGRRDDPEFQDLHNEIRQVLNLPENLFIINLITLGYPDQDPPPRPRKMFNTVVSLEKYGQNFD